MITSVGASAVASALSRIIGLVRNVALAWLIPQAQFGLFGVAVLVVNMLLPLCSAGLYEGVMRYAPYHEARGSLRGFVLRAATLLTVVVVGCSAMLWIFAQPISELLFSSAQSGEYKPVVAGDGSELIGLLRVTILCVAALAVFHTLQGFFKGLHMFRAFGAAEVVSALIFTLLAIGGSWLGFGSARSLVLAYAVACAVGVLIFAPGWVIQLRNSNDPRATAQRNPAPQRDYDSSTLGEDKPVRTGAPLMSYSLWAAATAVSWHAMSYYPMWYLLKVSDGETVGAFHAVRLIAQVIQLGAVILTGVVAANVTRRWEHVGRGPALERLTLLTKASLLVLLVAASVLLLARPLVIRLFPASFVAGESAYVPMLLSYFLAGVVGLLAVRLTVLEKPRLICLIWCVGTIVTVAASAILVRPTVGDASTGDLSPIAAAAWAGVAGVTAALVACLVLVRKQGLGLEARSTVLVALCFLMVLGTVPVLCVVLVVLVVAFVTRIVFSASEFEMLRGGFACNSNPSNAADEDDPRTV